MPIWISQPAGGPEDWSFRAGPENAELLKLPIDAAARSALKIPASGMAWNLALGHHETAADRVSFRARLPWNQSGSIPLLSAPRQFSPRSTILLEVPSRMRSRVQSAGLSRLDTTMAERLAASRQPELSLEPAGARTSERAFLIAHAFTYSEPGGNLQLSTEELLPGLEAGMIRDVCLTTILHPNGPWLNRLRLLLHAEQRADLEFTMPPDSKLVRVQLDGADVVPTFHEGLLALALGAGSSGMRYKTLDLDFETRGRTNSSGAELRPELPRIGMPCLSFCWELVTPPGWQARPHGPGLLPGDPETTPSWPFGSLGLPELRWPGREPYTRTVSEETLRRLDEALASTTSEDSRQWRWPRDSCPPCRTLASEKFHHHCPAIPRPRCRCRRHRQLSPDPDFRRH